MKDILKNGLILAIYAMVAGLVLGGIYVTTKDAISNADASAKLKAMKEVLKDPQTGKPLVDERVVEKAMREDGEEVVLQETKEGKIYGPVYKFKTEDGKEVFVIVGASPGFGGDVKTMASFVKIDGDFYLNSIEVLDFSQETPGLGAKIGEKAIQRRFYPIPPEGLKRGVKVNKDAGVSTGDPEELRKRGIVMTSDVMTGATITPRAVANSINLMYRYLREHESRGD